MKPPKVPARCKLGHAHCVGPDREITNRCTQFRCWSCLDARITKVAKRAGVWSGGARP